MTPDQFVARMIETVVEDGMKSYRGILADPGEVTDPYWKRVLDLYRSLPPRHRKVVLEIMRQVQTDTLSEVFGILDGSTSLGGRSGSFELTHKTQRSHVRLNGDLQDRLLEKTESS